ncbi:MAG: phage major capsid protein [Shimia thalassica]|uniref:phage major capsid protein n=1 Tax=Shimia thalassica TaxID=1715693 RepID=UPI00329817EA
MTTALDRLSAVVEKTAPKPIRRSAPVTVETRTAPDKILSKRLAKLTAENVRLKQTAKQRKVAAKPKPKMTKATGTEILTRAIASELIRRRDPLILTDGAALDMVVPKHDKVLRACVEAVLKSDSHTATTLRPTWGEELASDLTAAFIEDVGVASVYGPLAAAGQSFEFGRARSVSFPWRDQNTPIPASWVAENATLPVKDGRFDSSTLNRHKLAVLVSLSDEIVDASVSNLLQIVRSAVVRDTAEAVDQHLTSDDTAISGVRPAGLLQGAANQPSAGNTIAQITTDLKYLASQAIAGRYIRPVLIMHPLRVLGLKMATASDGYFPFRQEIEAFGTIFGVPIIASESAPLDRVAIVSSGDFYTAADTPEFRASQDASIVMLNDDGTDPTMTATNAVDTGGSVKVSDAADVVGGPAQVVSAFQQGLTVVRIVQPMSWVLVRPAAAFVSGVDW